MKKIVLMIVCFVYICDASMAIAAPGARVWAKRLGLGFTNQIAIGDKETIPSLDAKYYFNRKNAFSLSLGFDTKSSDSVLAFGGKFYRSAFVEDFMNFYLGVGLALLSKDGSSLQINGFLGSEFFFPGLPSLGFSFEAGIRGDKTTGAFALRTTGESFTTAGIHFYF